MTQQHWDPNRYIRNASFVAELGMPVVELLDPKPGERILDLGCGDGALTAKLAALGCDVVGVDASADQISAAKARGLSAQVVDAQSLPFKSEFDAVFSNAVLHWIKRPDDVIVGVARALKKHGRFVGEFGGATNVATVVDALSAALAGRGIDAAAVNPWYFPTPEEYRAKLEAHGLEVQHIELFPRPTPLPGSLIDWLETFGENFTNALPVNERSSFLAEVQEALRSKLCDAEGKWTVDYVRLRFAAALK
jgi:trans-aconitate methyltransferase